MYLLATQDRGWMRQCEAALLAEGIECYWVAFVSARAMLLDVAVSDLERAADALSALHADELRGCHTVVPDGVFVEDGEHLRFRRIGAPDPKEIEQIAWDTCVRTLSRLRREGRWVDEEAPGDDAEDTLAHDQPLLSALYGASITGRIALGPQAGQRVMRFGAFPKPGTEAQRARLPAAYGFDVHARVTIERGDAKGLERLCRYLLRPPAGNERFTEVGDGRIALRLKKRWSDGTTHMVFTPAQLVEKLAALIPPPRKNQLRYHGVFAPRHALRSRIVPKPQAEQSEATPGTAAPCPHRIAWAKLMRRVFDIDVLQCPRCDSQMQRIAFITKPDAIEAILESVGYAGDSPAASAA